jgi:glycosyltransferase involved in cell wall biosynthesis
MLSVIIPANNEADYIGGCLDALLGSAPDPVAAAGRPPVEIIVVANACTDAIVAVARGYERAATARGWRLFVLDLEQGGKLNALNAGERAAGGDVLVYIDADIIVSPPLLAQLREALDRPEPAYASGRPGILPARSWFSRAYARVWMRVPFMTEGVPGCGVFAMNRAGRARWGAYPPIISDDTFARLQFAPDERIGVPAGYEWPIAEGFATLVRVRRRQDVGVAEVARLFPALVENDDKPRFGLARLLRLAVTDPVGVGVYAAVALAVRLSPGSEGWVRGR